MVQGAFKELKFKAIVSVCAYLASIPLAYVNRTISGCLFLLVVILWLIPERKIEEAIKAG